MTAFDPVSVCIEAGTFMMGCEQGRDEEKPLHQVRVREFEMAVFQTRRREYERFLRATRYLAPPQWEDPDFSDPDQPVVAVSWSEAAKYCEWLSSVSGRRYRLPTEAEWEWAACGGHAGWLYPWGDEAPESRREYLERWGGKVKAPLPAGRGSPNGWGLHDIGENVHEWCSDWFSRDYYKVSPEDNPRGPETGERKASRGGSWRHHIKASRCAARSSIPPHFQYADYGFRVVREIE